MNNIVDMHCHIIPELDDGARNWNETYKMLQAAYDEGVRIIAATPHHHERRGMCHPSRYKENLTVIRQMARDIDPAFHIVAGMEIKFNQDVVCKLEHKKVKTMGKSQYVLIEFSPNDEFKYIQQGLQQIQAIGYLPIIAHIERYECLVDNMENVTHLIEMGIYIQVNSGSIIGNNGRTIKKFVKALLSKGYVHFVGTDAHDSGARSPRMKKSARYVQKKYGKEYADKIFRTNGMKVFENKIL